jgi:glucan phosphoethanolaminetransferase (alkaline phosphatase superfamily)
MIAIGWALNIYLFKQKRYAEALFMFICTLVPLLTSTNAVPRYMFGLYPTSLAIVLIARDRPNLRPIMLAISAMLSSYFVIAWVNAKFFTV